MVLFSIDKLPLKNYHTLVKEKGGNYYEIMEKGIAEELGSEIRGGREGEFDSPCLRKDTLIPNKHTVPTELTRLFRKNKGI